MSIASYDGKFVEKSSLTVGMTDFGFARGMTVFELTRVYGGKPFRLQDHLDRFEQGADAFGIRCPLPRTEIIAQVDKIISQNGYAHSAVKFYLTAGECAKVASVGLAGSDGFTPHLAIMEDEVKPAHPEAPKGLDLYQRGIALKTVPFSRQLPAFKTINYAPAYHAGLAAAKAGYDDILFTHHDGYVTETTISNFFVVIGDMLCTPARGMLYGVTRKVLLELACDLGMGMREAALTPADLRQATEAFITGSIVEMMPVRKIDDIILPTTVDGPVFKQLRRAFSEAIGKNLG